MNDLLEMEGDDRRMHDLSSTVVANGPPQDKNFAQGQVSTLSKSSFTYIDNDARAALLRFGMDGKAYSVRISTLRATTERKSGGKMGRIGKIMQTGGWQRL